MGSHRYRRGREDVGYARSSDTSPPMLAPRTNQPPNIQSLQTLPSNRTHERAQPSESRLGQPVFSSELSDDREGVAEGGESDVVRDGVEDE